MHETAGHLYVLGLSAVLATTGALQLVATDRTPTTQAATGALVRSVGLCQRRCRPSTAVRPGPGTVRSPSSQDRSPVTRAW